MQELMIVKLGGSAITRKSSEKPEVNHDTLNRLAKEMGKWYSPEKKVIIIHGAGSYGHVIVKKTGIHKGVENPEQRKAFAETQRLQNELDTIVCKALINEGVPAFPLQASSTAVMERGRLKKMDCEVIKGLVNNGIVPVLYGVPAYDTVQVCSILSGDVIAPYLALELGAKMVIHGTNVNGVYTGDPKKDPDAKQIPEINQENWGQVKNALGLSADTDVTGGMKGKVEEAYELARKGVKSRIIDITTPDNLFRALNGESIGTLIR